MARNALRLGATRGQGGGRACVIFATPVARWSLAGGRRSSPSVGNIVWMTRTPPVIRLAERVALAVRDDGDGLGYVSCPPARIIVAGFGRVGPVVARVMRPCGIDLTPNDHSPARIRFAAAIGARVDQGDARRIDGRENLRADEVAFETR